MKLLINFATKNFSKAQKINSETAYKIAGFDKVIEYSPKDIDKDFYHKNRAILSEFRGAGYWLWKPYFILKTLEQLGENDILCYCDSGVEFIDKIDKLVDLINEYKQDIIPFELEYKNYQYTKRDTFILLNCDEDYFYNSNQCLSGYFIIRKTPFSLDFFNQFLNYAYDYRILTDSVNECGKSNLDGFIEHRHDQSIFSLLVRKHKLTCFRDPSQFGDNMIGKYPNSQYGSILNVTRKANINLLFAFKKYSILLFRKILKLIAIC